MNNKIVVDASPLILLLKTRLDHVLQQLFTEVIVPNAVRREIEAGPENDLARIRLSEIDWAIVPEIEQSSTSILDYDLGQGETEALSIAFGDSDATVLLDDFAARRTAKDLGISYLGTGGLLVKAKRKRSIDSFSDAMKMMIESGLWISPEVLNILRQKAGE